MKFIKYAFLFLAFAIPFYLVVTSQGSTEHHPSPPCDNPKLLSGLADVIDAQSDHHVKVLDSKNYRQISYDEKTDHRYCTGNFLLSLGSYSIAYPYPAKAGCPTIAGRRRTRAAPAGMAPALSWS